MHSFRFSVLGSTVCFFSPFPVSLPQLFHRCLPLLSLRYFPFSFRILSFASGSLPATWLTVSSVPFIRVFCLTAASSLLPFRFRLLAFLFPICLVSRASLPILCTWLSVCFLSSFPASLPRLFRWCSPFISSGCLSFAFCFLSSASALGTDYSAFRFYFSLHPASPNGGSVRANLSAFRYACCHAFLSALVLSMMHLPFTVSCFATHRLLQDPAIFLSALRQFPLVNTLGSGYLAGDAP